MTMSHGKLSSCSGIRPSPFSRGDESHDFKTSRTRAWRSQEKKSLAHPLHCITHVKWLHFQPVESCGALRRQHSPLSASFTSALSELAAHDRSRASRWSSATAALRRRVHSVCHWSNSNLAEAEIEHPAMHNQNKDLILRELIKEEKCNQ